MTLSLRFTFLLLVTLSLNISADEYSKYTKKIDNILKTANVDMEFTGNILIAHREEIYYQRSLGYADKDKKIKLTSQHRLSTGSISKEFSTIAIMMLEEQGRIDYKDPLAKYLPEFPAWASKITIEQILSHTSGLPQIKWKQSINTQEVIEQIMAVETLSFKPGTSYLYGNLNVVLRALIIEKITTQLFTDYIQDNLFAPAGMTNSYNRLDEGEIQASVLVEEYNSAILGVSFYSTPYDLYQWNKALLNYKFVSKKSMVKALAEHSLHPVAKQYHFDFGGFNKNESGVLSQVSHPGSFFNHHAITVSDYGKNINVIIMSSDGRKPTIYELNDYILNINSYDKGQIPASWWLKDKINKLGLAKALSSYKIAIKQDRKLIANESALNKLGYSYSHSNLDNAIAIMKLNVELYPKSANTYDSYAELLIKAKKYKKAAVVINKGLVLAKSNKDDGLIMSLSNLIVRLPEI